MTDMDNRIEAAAVFRDQFTHKYATLLTARAARVVRELFPTAQSVAFSMNAVETQILAVDGPGDVNLWHWLDDEDEPTPKVLEMGGELAHQLSVLSDLPTLYVTDVEPDDPLAETNETDVRTRRVDLGALPPADEVAWIARQIDVYLS